MNNYWHSRPLPEVFSQLSSSNNGLNKEEAKRRIEKYGYNELPTGEQRHPVFIFLKQFHSILIYILFAAAGISFIFGKTIDMYVIFAVIGLNAIMGFLQEYKAEKAIQALKQMIIPYAKVFRDGDLFQIPAKELVPGDVIMLEEGDRIPADARLFEIKNLRTEEASLTGESMPSNKELKVLPEAVGIGDRKNMVFMGTFVIGGTARAVVAATGIKTIIGEIAKGITEIKRVKGHFEQKTDKLAKQMGIIAIFAASLTFLVGFFVRGFEFSEIFLFTIASLVSGIPEGLPAILVIVLAIGVYRMAKRNAIIRRLSATETLGVVNVIATDKTGTLTANTMNVEKILLFKEEDITVTGNGWVPKGNFLQKKEIIFPLEKPALSKILHIASVCNNSRLVSKKEEYKIIGDPTEAALVVLGEKAGLKKEVIESKEKRIDDFPFNSELKYRASLSILKEEEDKKEIYVVGAPESVLECSTHYLDGSKVRKINDKERKEMLQRIDSLTKNAMRVIALAYKPVKKDTRNLSEEMIKGLIITGVVGMIDPPRKGVKEAIAKAKRAGIRIVMMTGDHKETALAIAKEVGLVEGNEQKVYTERDLLKMSGKEFEKAVKTVSVFARLAPSTKLKIANILQKQGNIIAMTGDGVNDALAVKKADIGIAMGIMGTDVTRESAEIVLADDNFASIVNAVEEGRTVFVNTRQSSAFLITTNFAEHATIIGTLFLGMPLPLLPTQILWLNLVTDGVSGSALAAEPGHKEILEEPPRKSKEDILSQEVIPFLCLMVVVMMVSVILVFNLFLPDCLEKARTGAFLVMAFTQLFNVFNMRSIRNSLFSIGLFTNKYVIVAFLASVILQVAAIYIPFFQNIFHFTPLSLMEIIFIIIVSSFVLWFGELFKFGRQKWIKISK